VEKARESYLDALLLPTVEDQLLFEAYKNIGNIYLKDHHIDVAEDFYHKAYSLNSESAPLMVNLGTLELQKKDQSGAIERFRMALRIDQKFSPAWVGLALSYHLFGDFQMAWASILRAVECDVKNGTALLLMAQWCTKHDSIPYALKVLSSYFDQGLYEASLSLAFIELCIQSGELSLARWEVERSLLWDPKNVEILQFDRALEQNGY
jgi:Tfp pilus assembly protein PilF